MATKSFSLDADQWLQLVAQARSAKEYLLNCSEEKEHFYTVVVQGKGASVIKGSLSLTLSSQEVKKFFLGSTLYKKQQSFLKALDLKPWGCHMKQSLLLLSSLLILSSKTP